MSIKTDEQLAIDPDEVTEKAGTPFSHIHVTTEGLERAYAHRAYTGENGDQYPDGELGKLMVLLDQLYEAGDSAHDARISISDDLSNERGAHHTVADIERALTILRQMANLEIHLE